MVENFYYDISDMDNDVFLSMNKKVKENFLKNNKDLRYNSKSMIYY